MVGNPDVLVHLPGWVGGMGGGGGGGGETRGVGGMGGGGRYHMCVVLVHLPDERKYICPCVLDDGTSARWSGYHMFMYTCTSTR